MVINHKLKLSYSYYAWIHDDLTLQMIFTPCSYYHENFWAEIFHSTCRSWELRTSLLLFLITWWSKKTVMGEPRWLVIQLLESMWLSTVSRFWKLQRLCAGGRTSTSFSYPSAMFTYTANTSTLLLGCKKLYFLCTALTNSRL